ncbi:hypothetical protein EDC01DRAFT_628443 [Geopyxis carbonaria]|nr:hypothetical protein EDC01DRAFT_628443 [Geopyxis carbonaria]
MADPPGSSPALTSRSNPSPALSSTSSRLHLSVDSQMAPPATTASSSQYYRFRLGEFQRVGTPTTAPPGQCSRFRVSNFVPYGAEAQNSSPGQSVMNGVTVNSRPRSSSAQSSSPQMEQTGNVSLPGTGSFSVMHMDLDREVPQVTSNSVAATGGRGMLKHKVNVQSQKQQVQVPNVQEHMSPQMQHKQRPVVTLPSAPEASPNPMPPIPMSSVVPEIANSSVTFPSIKFEPSQYPEDLRYELARVLSNIQRSPSEFITKVTTALLSAPSFEEKSFLRHICSLYPTMPATPIQAHQQIETQTPSKRKRGRPPGKKKSVTGTPTATTNGEASMAPPSMKQMGVAPDLNQDPDLAAAQAQSISVAQSRKDKDGQFETCTRCLKQFNPSWRTPSFDPTSEFTCSVPHPYPDHTTGLVVSLPARKRNNYKTTWRWRCCGREVQSASDDLSMWPREEDDKTGGWCFVGRHTLEPGVREKLGLKTGKGRTIEEVADVSSDNSLGSARKRARVDPSVSSDNNGRITDDSISMPQMGPGQPQQLVWPQQEGVYMQPPLPQTQTPPQPQSSPNIDLHTSEPPKRKRGRPKGSRSKTKGTSVPPGSAETTSPETQLLTEASQTHSTTNDENGHLHVNNGDAGSSNFWTQYTEPHLPDLTGNGADDHDTIGTSDGRLGPVENMGITPDDLGMLVSATVAMRGDKNGINGLKSPMMQGGKTPAKRGRGRPKGVKNGTGRAALEKKRVEQEQQQQQQAQQQQQQQQHQEQEQSEVVQQEQPQHHHNQQVHHHHHHHTAVTNGGPAEITNLGGGWFPGDDQPWGHFG